MLQREEIERRLADVLPLVGAFHQAVVEVQARAVRQVLVRGQERATSIRLAQQAIEQARQLYTRQIDKTLSASLEKMLFKDLRVQLRIVETAKAKGKNIAAPFFTRGFQLRVMQEMVTERRFAENIVRRLSVNSTNKLIDILEMAIEDTRQGIPLEQTIRAASQLIREEGVTIKYPASGRVVRDPVAYMRQNLVTQIATDSGDRQKAIYDSLDVPLEDKWIEVSAHMGARPSHAVWQGKIFKTWREFEDTTGYRQVDGLAGTNCRHVWYAFINGVSERAYRPYDIEENERKYRQLQQQRRLEAEIRKYKLADAVNKELGEGTRYGKRIRGAQARLRQHIKSTGLTRRRDREQI